MSLDLGERERCERMVEGMIEAEAAEGRECTREQVVAALSLFKPFSEISRHPRPRRSHLRPQGSSKCVIYGLEYPMILESFNPAGSR